MQSPDIQSSDPQRFLNVNTGMADVGNRGHKEVIEKVGPENADILNSQIFAIGVGFEKMVTHSKDPAKALNLVRRMTEIMYGDTNMPEESELVEKALEQFILEERGMIFSRITKEQEKEKNNT